ncbi:MAG: hypothetical protein LC808_33105, partial [Actinobacteria bacterium]|nr:hypothetical protein [Actinomycetota bacterium]
VDEWVDEHADILTRISGVLKTVSAIAGVLSFIPILAPICGPIAMATAGVALLIDSVLVATGNGDWKAMLVDAALMALPGVGKLVKVGVKSARSARGARVVAKGVTGADRAADVAKAAPRLKPEWLKRLIRGNQFNKDRRAFYPHNELYVKRPGGGYYRVDSYNDNLGEIVSRKHSQLAEVQEQTAFKYLKEIDDKYAPGTEIADVRSTHTTLVGEKLEGQKILEIPVQETAVPRSVLDEGTTRNILIRDVNGKVYNGASAESSLAGASR